ncbi:MAG: hypothetical protein JO041_15640 [Acidobacteria bacterium]|nr:hypothetical protein [Acidobacteriota bacterium]
MPLFAIWAPAIVAAASGLITLGMMRQALRDFAVRIAGIERRQEIFQHRLEQNSQKVSYLEGAISSSK